MKKEDHDRFWNEDHHWEGRVLLLRWILFETFDLVEVERMTSMVDATIKRLEIRSQKIGQPKVVLEGIRREADVICEFLKAVAAPDEDVIKQ